MMTTSEVSEICCITWYIGLDDGLGYQFYPFVIGLGLAD